MVQVIIFLLSVIVFFLLVINWSNFKTIRRQKEAIDWWQNKCVKNEQELRELKEKQNKRKKSTGKYTLS